MVDVRKKPTLTVIVPNFNHAVFLPQTLKAILTQSRLPDEIIILDDLSTDNSSQIISNFSMEYPLIQFIQNSVNMGVLSTINKGFEMATGDYIHSCGADDLVLPNFYERSMKILEEYPQAGLCSTLSNLINETGENLGVFPSAVVSRKSIFFNPKQVQVVLGRYGSWFMGNSTIFKKETLKEIGLFRKDLASYADGFCSELIALKCGACFIPEPLVAWRRMQAGYSSTVSKQVSLIYGIFEKTEMIMENEYSEYFSHDYIHLWKRRQILSLLTKKEMADPLQKNELLKLQLKLPDRSFIDHFFFILMEKYGRATPVLLAVYLFVQKTIFQNLDTFRRRFLGWCARG